MWQRSEVWGGGDDSILHIIIEEEEWMNLSDADRPAENQLDPTTC